MKTVEGSAEMSDKRRKKVVILKDKLGKKQKLWNINLMAESIHLFYELMIFCEEYMEISRQIAESTDGDFKGEDFVYVK